MVNQSCTESGVHDEILNLISILRAENMQIACVFLHRDAVDVVHKDGELLASYVSKSGAPVMVCSAAWERRYGQQALPEQEQLAMAGLAQWIDASDKADRVMVWGQYCAPQRLQLLTDHAEGMGLRETMDIHLAELAMSESIRVYTAAASVTLLAEALHGGGEMSAALRSYAMYGSTEFVVPASGAAASLAHHPQVKFVNVGDIDTVLKFEYDAIPLPAASEHLVNAIVDGKVVLWPL